MWDDELDTALAVLWEALCSSPDPLRVEDIKKITGLPASKIYSAIGVLREVELISQASQDEDEGASVNTLWKCKKTLTAIEWARAVEAGVPLTSLEKTVSLSAKDKKEATRVAISGEVDEEREERKNIKAQKRQSLIRGRAATRAATTDLAKIIQDAQEVLSTTDKNSKVREVFKREAEKALEALVKAMERG